MANQTVIPKPRINRAMKINENKNVQKEEDATIITASLAQVKGGFCYLSYGSASNIRKPALH